MENGPNDQDNSWLPKKEKGPQWPKKKMPKNGQQWSKNLKPGSDGLEMAQNWQKMEADERKWPEIGRTSKRPQKYAENMWKFLRKSKICGGIILKYAQTMCKICEMCEIIWQVFWKFIANQTSIISTFVIASDRYNKRYNSEKQSINSTQCAHSKSSHLSNPHNRKNRENGGPRLQEAQNPTYSQPNNQKLFLKSQNDAEKRQILRNRDTPAPAWSPSSAARAQTGWTRSLDPWPVRRLREWALAWSDWKKLFLNNICKKLTAALFFFCTFFLSMDLFVSQNVQVQSLRWSSTSHSQSVG